MRFQPPSQQSEDEDDLPAIGSERWRACSCGECGLAFTGVGPFDAHRVGQWDRPGTIHTNARRCLSPAELRLKGYAPNEFGRWRRHA